MAERARLLIVDDDESMVLLLKETLLTDTEVYEIETAKSGEEAVIKIAQQPFDLIIADLKMPGIDGLEVIRAARAMSPSTRVILMTAYGSIEVEAEARRLQVYEYVTKPFLAEEMRQVVQQALGRIAISQKDLLVLSDARSLGQPVYEQVQELGVNTGARCVLLLSSSGYPIETVGYTEGLDISSVSALVAANFMAAEELAKRLGSGSVFKSSYHEGQEGTDYNIYAYDVNGELLLAVIFGAESTPGIVWFYTKQTATALASLVVDQSSTIEFEDDLTTAIDAELDQLFDSGDNDDGGKLMSLQEAIAAELVLAELDGEEPA